MLKKPLGDHSNPLPLRTGRIDQNDMFQRRWCPDPGGETSIWGVHGGVLWARVIKNSEKGMSIFYKNSGKGYNICKKFHIGSVILMTQITNQKKTKLIDFFDLVWTKIHNFWKIFWKWKPLFSQNSPQNHTLETSIRHKNSEKGPTFSSKIPERVDIEIL